MLGLDILGKKAPKSAPRTIVITGASDGIGLAATRILLDNGHRVISVGRNRKRVEQLRQELKNEWFICDFADFNDVTRLVEELGNAVDSIDVLCNNAGAIFPHYRYTQDGFEETLQVNHLSPMLLTFGLLPQLQRGLGSVVFTSSIAGTLFADVDVDDLNWRRRPYDSRVAYGNSKLFNAMMAKEVSQRYSQFGIYGVSFHPGVVASHFASTDSGWLGLVYTNPVTRVFLTTTKESANRIVYLAQGTVGKDFIPGGYYKMDRLTPYPKAFADPTLAPRIFDVTCELLGVDADALVDGDTLVGLPEGYQPPSAAA